MIANGSYWEGPMMVYNHFWGRYSASILREIAIGKRHQMFWRFKLHLIVEVWLTLSLKVPLKLVIYCGRSFCFMPKRSNCIILTLTQLGLFIWLVWPSPSWPHSLAPKVNSLPDCVTTAVCSSPQASRITWNGYMAFLQLIFSKDVYTYNHLYQWTFSSAS